MVEQSYLNEHGLDRLITRINTNLYGRLEYKGDLSLQVTDPATGQLINRTDFNDMIPCYVGDTYRLTGEAVEIDGIRYKGGDFVFAQNAVRVTGTDVDVLRLGFTGDALIDTEELYTDETKIDNQALYRFNETRVVTNRYKLTAAAVAAGYKIDADGLHNRTTLPIVDAPWSDVKIAWTSFSSLFEIDSNGVVYYMQDAALTDFELVYDYINIDGTIWHYYKHAWHTISIINITKQDIDDLDFRF